MAGKEQAQAQEQRPGLIGRIIERAREDRDKQPNIWAQIGAMLREAVKDIRQTFNEVYFGRGEHAPEMGTPGNPTPQNVTDALGNSPDKGKPANDNRSDYEKALAASAAQAPQQSQERRQSRGM